MREILFRGKRTDNGKMVFGDLIHGVGDKRGNMYILPISSIYPKDCNNLDGYEIIPETVSQFTGFKCPISEENLFEDDILEVTDEDGKITIGQIIWDDFIGWWTIATERCTYGDGKSELNSVLGEALGASLDRSDVDIAKIGNIHDNPELLEVSND